MTIHFPDLAQYQSSVNIQTGTVAVIARATLSASFADTRYATFKQQAASKGAKFAAYHWLNHGNIANQAKWAFAHVGTVPLMIDAEDVSGNTGYAGPLTVADLTSFATTYRSLGGICNLFYLPHWYWQEHMGSPDLSPCKDTGLHLVSSYYTTYSDSGPGWAPYGNMTPEQWQYTDSFTYSGAPCDFNAYKGTVSQWWTMVNGRSHEVVTTPEEHAWENNADKYLWHLVTRTKDFSDIINANGDAITIHNNIDDLIEGIDTKVTALASASGGLTPADRQLMQDLLEAVTALNSRLSTP